MATKNTATASVHQAREELTHRRRLIELAALLAKEIIPNNPSGFTICPRTGEAPVFEADVFIVSLDGFERQFSVGPSTTAVLAWLSNAAQWLARDNVYVGGWTDPESRRFCLDISVPVHGRFMAERIGQVNGQSCIYHPASQRCIPLRRTKAA